LRGCEPLIVCDFLSLYAVSLLFGSLDVCPRNEAGLCHPLPLRRRLFLILFNRCLLLCCLLYHFTYPPLIPLLGWCFHISLFHYLFFYYTSPPPLCNRCPSIYLPTPLYYRIAKTDTSVPIYTLFSFSSTVVCSASVFSLFLILG